LSIDWIDFFAAPSGFGWIAEALWPTAGRALTGILYGGKNGGQS